MSNIKRRLLTILVIALCISTTIYAQRDYASAIGIRSWPYWGANYKQFVTDQTAIDIIASSKWNGLMLDGLYEFHHDAFKTSNFNLLYGFGGHVGWWGNKTNNQPWLDNDDTMTIGINLIAGTEYSFDEIPFSISLDWKPLFVLAEKPGIDHENISFTVRYNIK